MRSIRPRWSDKISRTSKINWLKELSLVFSKTEMELPRSSRKCNGFFAGEVIVPKAALGPLRPVKNVKDRWMARRASTMWIGNVNPPEKKNKISHNNNNYVINTRSGEAADVVLAVNRQRQVPHFWILGYSQFMSSERGYCSVILAKIVNIS